MTWQVEYKVTGSASVEVEAESAAEAEAIAQELVDAQDDEVEISLKFEVYETNCAQWEDCVPEGEDALDEAERDEA